MAVTLVVFGIYTGALSFTTRVRSRPTRTWTGRRVRCPEVFVRTKPGRRVGTPGGSDIRSGWSLDPEGSTVDDDGAEAGAGREVQT